MIELRVLTGDDWQAWRELRLATLADSPAAFSSALADWQGDGDREQRWRARLELPGAHNLLALLDGRPSGMVTGLPVPCGDTVELLSMWVAPAARGRGVSDALITAVERWAAARGARVLRLAVKPGNAPAIALYERHGFRPTDEQGDVLADGLHHELVMARPV